MMRISFSKAWGDADCRWNYCGGDWNYRTLSGFMSYYGIKEAWIIGKVSYYEGEKEIECNEYGGWATKELDRLKRHWRISLCKVVRIKSIVPKPLLTCPI